MAIQVAAAADAAKKYAQRAANAQGDYASGIKGKGTQWQTATAGAADNWEAGVQAAITRKAFSKGVTAAGGTKYEQNATTVGPARYAQGVQNGASNWAAGVQPYLDTLSNLTLPPKGPKGAPQNMQRAQAVADALRKKKVGG